MTDLHRRITRLERILAYPFEGPEPPRVIRILGGLPATADDPGHAYARGAWLERGPLEPIEAFEGRALDWARALSAEFLILGGLPPCRRN